MLVQRNRVLEATANEDGQLKMVDLIKIEGILADQKTNEDMQNIRNRLVENNVYFKKARKKEKIVLQGGFNLKVFKAIHENLCHISTKQMLKKLRPIYTAKNFTKNIKIVEIVKALETNQVVKANKDSCLIQAQPQNQPPTRQYLQIQLENLEAQDQPKRYLHLLVDHVTRYTLIVTSKTQEC